MTATTFESDTSVVDVQVLKTKVASLTAELAGVHARLDRMAEQHSETATHSAATAGRIDAAVWATRTLLPAMFLACVACFAGGIWVAGWIGRTEAAVQHQQSQIDFLNATLSGVTDRETN